MATAAQVHEISRIEYRDGFYLVLILSAATGRWIVQGEHRNRADAQRDLLNWR